MLSACSLVVTQADYDMDKEKTRKDFVAIRGQLLAHTQILANHGKSLNEFKLQLRDAVSNVEKTVKELKSKPTPVIVSPKLERKKESVGKLVKQNRKSKETRYIRRTYQGLLLSYAGGYDEPRGSRYPYKLKPGTRVAIIPATGVVSPEWRWNQAVGRGRKCGCAPAGLQRRFRSAWEAKVDSIVFSVPR